MGGLFTRSETGSNRSPGQNEWVKSTIRVSRDAKPGLKVDASYLSIVHLPARRQTRVIKLVKLRNVVRISLTSLQQFLVGD